MSDRTETPENIYASALSEEDATALLRVVEGAEGLDNEIDVLRLLLSKQLSEPEGPDLKLLQGGIRLLIQALLAQHRLTPQQAETMGESMVAFLEQFGGALLAADSADE